MIDVALYEAVFNCMESLLPEYSAFGAVRERGRQRAARHRADQRLPCSDGGYVLIAGNGDSIFRRLMGAIGRDDLRDDPALATTTAARARWRGSTPRSARGRDAARRAEVLAALEKAEVPAGRIYTVADIAADPHYPARGMIQEVARRRRRAAQGAGHRAQAVRHAGRDPQPGAEARRAHRAGFGFPRIRLRRIFPV